MAESPSAVTHPEGRLQLGDAVVDLERRRVERPGAEPVGLTWMETQLLAYLAAHARPVPSQELLTEVWRYSEGAVSRTVASTVRRTRRKIEPAPRSPSYLITSGGAYELRCSRPEGGQAEAKAEASRGAAPRLPRAHVPRTDIVDELERRLGEGGVLLHGEPGGGKTTALVELADRFAGVVWCDLAGASTASELFTALARALGLRIDDLEDDRVLERRVRSAASSQGHRLLVLDHVEDAVPLLEQVAPLAGRVVLGSRLASSGFPVVRLPPMSDDQAAALLRRAAPDDPAGVARLARRLGGNPLALSLAAARLRTLSCSQLDAFLERSQAVLARRDGASLDAAVADSCRRLTAEARTALDAAAIFADAFDGEGLLEVAGDDAGVGTLDGLEELVDHGLVSPVLRGRFSVSGPVRGHVLERLADRGRLEERHARQVLARCEALALRTRGDGGPAALAALLSERPELDLAFRRVRRESPDLAARILLCFEPLTWREPAWLHLRAAAELLARDLPPATRAGLLRFRGTLLDARGRSTEALEDFEAVLALGREVAGDEATKAQIRAVHIARRLGRPTEAEERAERAVTWALAGQLRHLVPDARVAQGIHALVRGRDEDALALFQQALAEFRGLGDRWGEGIVHLNLGIVFRRLGKPEDGIHHQREAIGILEEHDDRSRLANAWGNLGNALLAARRFEEAERAYREAVEAGQALGSPLREARALNHLSALLLETGRLEESVALGERCLRMHRETGDWKYELQVSTNLALADLIRGRLREAEERLAAVDALPARRDAAVASYHRLALRALLAQLEGDHRSAQRWYREAEEALDPGAGPTRADLLGRWAVADARAGDRSGALERLAQARACASQDEGTLIEAFAAAIDRASGRQARRPDVLDGTAGAVARLLWERAGDRT